jgi:hypothetical protein
MENRELTEALNRLMQSVTDYQKFVAGTRSMQLAVEGVRDPALAVAAAELALRNFSTSQDY